MVGFGGFSGSRLGGAVVGDAVIVTAGDGLAGNAADEFVAGDVKDNCAAMIAVASPPGRKLGRVRMEVSPTARSADLLAFADSPCRAGVVPDLDHRGASSAGRRRLRNLERREQPSVRAAGWVADGEGPVDVRLV